MTPLSDRQHDAFDNPAKAAYGEDPNAKGRKTYFYLHRGLIAKILPLWGIRNGNIISDAGPTHDQAKVYWADIIDTAGNHYSCGDRDEMVKLMGKEEFKRFRGKPPDEKRRIGFDSMPDS